MLANEYNYIFSFFSLLPFLFLFADDGQLALNIAYLLPLRALFYFIDLFFPSWTPNKEPLTSFTFTLCNSGYRCHEKTTSTVCYVCALFP